MTTHASNPNDHIITPPDKVLAEISEANRNKKQVEVVIIGAGIAGLVAAYELTKLGHSVTILEGSERVGGRIHTYYFPDGQYGELGAMRIADSQRYTIHYIDEMGLTKGRFYNYLPNNLYDAMGVVTKMSDAPKTLYPLFALSDADRQIASKCIADGGGVGGIYSRYLNRVVDSTSQNVLEALFDLSLGNSREYTGYGQIDGVSLLHYLQNNADSQQRFDVEDPEANQVYSLGAIQMIGVLMSMEDLWATSLTIRVRDTLNQAGSVLWTIDGGMSKLPEALRDALAGASGPNTIRCGQNITGITVHPNAGQVTLDIHDEGSDTHHQQTDDYVLCTIPFGVLRKTRLAGISQGKLRAIRAMNYCSSTKVLLHCRDRFWERDYGIFGGATKSQGISRQTYYPNDNHPKRHEPFQGIHRQVDVHAGGYPEDASDAANVGICPDHNPGALLASYSWGQNAIRLGGMSEQERVQAVTESVKSFHPEIEEYVDGQTSIAWDNHRWSLGAYGHLNPNDLAYYLPDAIRQEGSCYFAGEHLSIAPGWIEGAIWSSLQNVLSMVKSFPES